MKDPIEDVKRELRALGATGSSTGKGASKWVFPDGGEFVFERKTGVPAKDAKIAKRKLDDFMSERILSRPTVPIDAPAPAFVNGAAHVEVAPPPEPVVEAVALPGEEMAIQTPMDTPAGPMAERLASGLKQLESYQARLQSELDKVGKRISMLKSMEQYVGDEMFVELVRAVLPVEVPRVPQAISVPPLGPAKLDTAVRVHVHREAVETAISIIGDEREFKLSEVMDLVIGNNQIDDVERKRVRSAINGNLELLIEHGVIKKTKFGRGKSPAWFQRAKKAVVTVTMEPVGTVREISA